jgi:hypothetical protein
MKNALFAVDFYHLRDLRKMGFQILCINYFFRKIGKWHLFKRSS